MLIGYARVSTLDQTLDLQEDALRAVKCKQIYRDKISGAKVDRPGLDQALDHLREGDTLVVWRLDRLGRSLKDLIEFVTKLEKQGIGFMSLTEQIDTTTSSGKLIFHLFGALAEFERNLIRERTQAGLVAARTRGRRGGRPSVLGKLDHKKVQQALQWYEEQERSVAEICTLLGIARSTFYHTVLPLAKQNTQKRKKQV
jgi:DNA invertase Pin-like site-specific DNA recombinase